MTDKERCELMISCAGDELLEMEVPADCREEVSDLLGHIQEQPFEHILDLVSFVKTDLLNLFDEDPGDVWKDKKYIAYRLIYSIFMDTDKAESYVKLSV